MRLKRIFTVLAVLSFLLLPIQPQAVLFAHQPIMDMAPRWENGWGFQVRYERRSSDKVLNGDSEIDNPVERKRDVNKTWLEGVYTFRREARVTFKIPWVVQSRTSQQNGKAVRQRGHGIGDLILGVPLKYYKNMDGWTQNVGFTPSVRLPTGSRSGDYPAGDGSTDLGLSLSYSAENPKWYGMFDLFYWINTDGIAGVHEGNQLGFDANVGYHALHLDDYDAGMYVMLDAQARNTERGIDRGGDSGGTRLTLGPVLVLYHGNVMFRAEYKMPVYENVSGTQVSYGNEANIGIGFSF